MWQQEFIKALAPADPANLDIERAMVIKDGNLPRFIYRYRAVNELSLNDLRDGTVWLSAPKEYNDPYDSAYSLSERQLLGVVARKIEPQAIESLGLRKYLSEREIEEALLADDPLDALGEVLLRKDANLAGEKGRRLKDALREATAGLWSKKVEELWARTQRDMRVCSFSEAHDTVLMWGHYANKHTGVCIEYPVGILSRKEMLRRLLYPVVYSESLFDATPYWAQSIECGGFNNLFGVVACLHKAKDWAYEKEWRIILPFGDAMLDRAYRMPPPSRILLGARISSEDERKVATAVSEKGVPVVKMRLSESRFRMEVVP